MSGFPVLVGWSWLVGSEWLDGLDSLGLQLKKKKVKITNPVINLITIVYYFIWESLYKEI